MTRLIITTFAILLAGCASAQPESASGTGPYTAREAQLMSAVWSEIREAARFEDIEWETVGLGAPPGDAEAQRLTARHWDALRRAARFEDINWAQTADYRESSPSPFAERDRLSETGPFTSLEAELMSTVWPDIRQAGAFEDINWEIVGLNAPPGDARAHRLMSRYWGELRRAARFEDINWAETTGYRSG